MSTRQDIYSRGRQVLTDGARTVTTRPFAALLLVIGLYLAWDLIAQLLGGELLLSTLAGYVWNGLMRGLVIGLAAVGLSMTYSILNFANFAHGDYITTGAFSGWAITYLIAGWGTADAASLLLIGADDSVFGAGLGIAINQTPLAIAAGVVVAGVATVGLALLLDRIVYRPLRDEEGIILLIASVGVAFALRYLIVFVFAVKNRGTTDASAVPRFPAMVWDGTVPIDAHSVTLIVVAGALMYGVHFLLQRTKLGKAMRAMSDNEDLARVTGIPTEQVVRWTWILGGGLSGVAGYLLVLWRGTLDFQLGWLLLLLVFAAVILGGIGSIYGAILGGVVIGLSMDLSVIWIPSEFNRAAAFAVMILILIYKPEGIFSGRSTA